MLFQDHSLVFSSAISMKHALSCVVHSKKWTCTVVFCSEQGRAFALTMVELKSFFYYNYVCDKDCLLTDTKQRNTILRYMKP
jgi:hypothetical protein